MFHPGLDLSYGDPAQTCIIATDRYRIFRCLVVSDLDRDLSDVRKIQKTKTKK